MFMINLACTYKVLYFKTLMFLFMESRKWIKWAYLWGLASPSSASDTSWRIGRTRCHEWWAWTVFFLVWSAIAAKRSSWRPRGWWARNLWPPVYTGGNWGRMSRSGAMWSPDCRQRKYSWCTGLEDSGSGVVCWTEQRGGHWFQCKL